MTFRSAHHPLLLVAFLPPVVAAGPWTFGGRVGVRQQGSEFVPNASLTAELAIGQFLSWRTDFEGQFQSYNSAERLTFSVPTQLLLHPVGRRLFVDPYLGPGLSASLLPSGDVAAGANALAGVAFQPSRGKTFGLEGRWSWPDLTRGTSNHYDLALTGNWNVQF